MLTGRSLGVLLSALALGATTSCGGGGADPGAGTDAAPISFDAKPGQSTGTVKGKTLTVADAVYGNFAATGASLNGISTLIVMSDLAGICPREASGVGTTNSRYLAIFLSVYDGEGRGAPPTQPGSFAVMENTAVDFPPNVSIARVFFQETQPNCFPAVIGEGSAGSVELTRVDPAVGVLEGTFTATFADGETLSGGFFAPRCAALNPNRTPLNGCP